MPATCPGPASPQTAHDPDVSACPECAPACEDEFDVQGPGVNPFCERPMNHNGRHRGTDPFGAEWFWSYSDAPAS